VHSSVMHKDNHVFVVGRQYKATERLWELLTKSKPGKDMVTI